MTGKPTIELEEQAPTTLAVAEKKTGWQTMLPTVKAACAPDATEDEFKVFIYQANRTGLDPLARQIYSIARYDGQSGKKKSVIQTGIDGFRVVAQRTGEYEGQTKAEWCDDKGVWKDVWLDTKPPAAARVGVLRKGFREPLYATAVFTECAQYTKERKPTNMWASKPALMLAKVAEAWALRRAFPSDLSGLYTTDEMPEHDSQTQVVEKSNEDLKGALVKMNALWERLKEVAPERWAPKKFKDFLLGAYKVDHPKKLKLGQVEIIIIEMENDLMNMEPAKEEAKKEPEKRKSKDET